MHWRMPCRQRSVAKTQSEAESKRAVKPRASRLAGSARGRASRIGEAVHKRHRELVGRTKYRRKEVKTLDKNKRAIRQEKSVLNSREHRSPCAGANCPRDISRTAIAFSAVVAQSPAIECQCSRVGRGLF